MNKYMLFINNFYELLNSGYSVIDSLNICYQIFNEHYIKHIIEQLKLGENIYDLIITLPLPKLFKDYFYFYKNKNSLSEALYKSIKIYEQSSSYTQKFTSQLTYPLVLLLFLFIFSLFVVFFLLPQMIILFDSFQIQTTIFTEIMFRLFHIIPLFYIVFILIMFIFIFNLIYAMKYKKSKIIELYLHLPFIGLWIKRYFTLHFALYYYELTNDALDPSSIIQLLNELLNHNELKIILYEINERMKQGEELENIIADCIYIDSLFCLFFKLYLSHPSDGKSILKYIELTYENIDLLISGSIKKIIPFVYCFVCLFVVGIYIAIIIPMMNIVSQF